MYADWPLASLAHWAEERDSADMSAMTTGRLLHRGPRLKMGICAGRPLAIRPDHLGRAEYIGASVTLASQIMEAGQSGTVVRAITVM